MKQINSLTDLKTIKKEFNEKKQKYKYVLKLCYGAGCISSDSSLVYEVIKDVLVKYNLEDMVKINLTGCMGMCDVGPIMIVEPEKVMYCSLDKENVEKIIKLHFVEKKIAIQYCYKDKDTKEPIPYIKDISFYKKQLKIVLENCGDSDFSDIEEYIAKDGYFAYEKSIKKLTREEIIDIILNSGLKGRGGGGFPTGLKWKFAYLNDSSEKYVVCNADEGDPGAFMDRSLVEGDPHKVIEGMAIAGRVIGANKGVVYVRAEYPLAIERIEEAIESARNRKLLGNNIFGSDFSFDIEVRIGAGAFVCGEETALLNSVEGKRGEPRQKPPFPSDAGLYDKPTVINNVETFGNIAKIILNGAQWFSNIGTKNSKGTKIFALAGDINNTGIIEVPMGMTLGEVIYDVGGGIPNNKKFKVAQSGGPSGGCITKEFLNTPIDYDSLKKLGAIMGSGGLIIMNEDSCMVDVAKYFMEFVQEESCGKCVACRLGTKRMLEILDRITNGEGVLEDIDKLIELGQTIKDTALCGLGQTAPNPVLSTIEHFREEYEEHINYNHCKAGVCAKLFISPCSNACPANVNIPGYVALIAEGRFRDAYDLIRQENPFPYVCGSVCTHPCENKCRRADVDESLAIADLKKFVADKVLKEEQPHSDVIVPKNGKTVGIIGAGPSGLTCGYYLARLGYDVEVYESQDIAGGVLAFGIPRYRLPKDKLKKEIDTIRRVGVNINLKTEIGKDITFKELEDKHDAVFIATGTQLSRKIGIEGEDLDIVYHGLDFLKDSRENTQIVQDKKVAVIGGGNTAIDAARVALRQGAKDVSILYRRELLDMPADKEEIEDAIKEGVRVHELISPVKIESKKDKSVRIILNQMELKGFDKNGRRKPVESSKEPIILDFDLIIPAVSQYSDLPFVRKEEVEVTKWGTFVIDKENHMTTKEGVFAGGDVVRGSDVVITAIADGKAAASSIDKYLGGKGVLNKGKEIEIPTNYTDEEIAEHMRFNIEKLDVDKRIKNFDEVNLGYHKLNAIAEAMRCLRCDRRL